MPAAESTRSPIRPGDGTIERIYVVWDVADDSQAVATAIALAPPSYLGLNRQSPRLSKLADGPMLWEVSFTYNPLEVKGDDPKDGGGDNGDDPPEGIVEFDGGGATFHITQSLETVAKLALIDQAIPDHKRAIGVSKDDGNIHVEGVDVPIPSGVLTVTKHWEPEEVSGAHIKGLLSLRGKLNKLAYEIDGEEYKPHELLFLGARGSRRGRQKWEITYSFDYDEERKIEIVPGKPKITKAPHDHLWVQYGRNVDAVQFLAVPEFAFSERLFEEADFAYYLGFPEVAP